MTHAGYRGSGPAIQDLVGGQIPLMFDPVQSVLPHIEAGRVRALALSNLARIPALPETPTMAGAGIPGHETTAWWAVVAPARTPEPVLTALADAIRRLAAADDWRSHLSRLGIDPTLRTGPELAAFARHWRFRSLRSRRLAARLSRRLCTSTSSTIPLWSTARQSQCVAPAILMATSSRCHLSPAQASRRRFRLAKA